MRTRLILAFINSTTSTSYHFLHCCVLSYLVAQQHRPKIAFSHKIAAPLFIHSLLSCYLIDLNVLLWMFFTPYTACMCMTVLVVLIPWTCQRRKNSVLKWCILVTPVQFYSINDPFLCWNISNSAEEVLCEEFQGILKQMELSHHKDLITKY